jgi:hypothetical protein
MRVPSWALMTRIRGDLHRCTQDGGAGNQEGHECRSGECSPGPRNRSYCVAHPQDLRSYCERSRNTGEVVGLTTLIPMLEGIATSCFQCVNEYRNAGRNAGRNLGPVTDSRDPPGYVVGPVSTSIFLM